jgi:tetratricopeptide (TPR) repeat protein
VIAAPLLVLLALGFSPFEVEEEHVRRGNERVRSGDPGAALREYDAAEQAVGARPEIDYDRGNAASRLGRLADAERHYHAAVERAAPPLASRALQNLGNARASAGDRPGAIAAYREALRKDPSNEDARYDLEVLLRQRDAPQGPGKKQEDGAGDAKRDEQTPQGNQPGERRAERNDPDRDHDSDRDPDRDRDADRDRDPDRSGQANRAAPLSRQDAEQLLDALRARERKMPFAGKERRDGGRRSDAEKDW